MSKDHQDRLKGLRVQGSGLWWRLRREYVWGDARRFPGKQVSRLSFPNIVRLTANDKDPSATISMTIRKDGSLTSDVSWSPVTSTATSTKGYTIPILCIVPLPSTPDPVTSDRVRRAKRDGVGFPRMLKYVFSPPHRHPERSRGIFLALRLASHMFPQGNDALLLRFSVYKHTSLIGLQGRLRASLEMTIREYRYPHHLRASSLFILRGASIFYAPHPP